MNGLSLTAVLLVVAACLWYGGRALVGGDATGPRFTALLADRPMVAVAVLGTVIVALVALGFSALLLVGTG